MNFPWPVLVYWVTTLLSSYVLATGVTHTLFRVTNGYKLAQGTKLKSVSFESITAIYCSILCSSGCGSATYSLKHKTCFTFVESSHNSSIVWSQDPDWVVLDKDQPVQYRDWTLVFLAFKEVNTPLYNAWTANGRHDDSLLSSSVLNGCNRLDNPGGCKQHFRSSILDNWKNIKEVKFSVYVAGSEVKYIVFNGTSTTRDSWFRRANILKSSWSGIKSDSSITHFGIPGFNDTTNRRRFVIHGEYGTCQNDMTYFLAVDNKVDYCSPYWSANVTNYPVFIYSTLNSMARLVGSAREYAIADKMAVFVKSN